MSSGNGQSPNAQANGGSQPNKDLDPVDGLIQFGGSSSDIQSFASSDAGAGYNANQLAALQSATQQNGQWIGSDGQNYSSLAASFLNWQSTNTTLKQNQQNYSAAALGQPGRDQTILTGPQINPNQSILGGNASIGKAF